MTPHRGRQTRPNKQMCETCVYVCGLMTSSSRTFVLESCPRVAHHWRTMLSRCKRAQVRRRRRRRQQPSISSVDLLTRLFFVHRPTVNVDEKCNGLCIPRISYTDIHFISNEVNIYEKKKLGKSFSFSNAFISNPPFFTFKNSRSNSYCPFILIFLKILL